MSKKTFFQFLGGFVIPVFGMSAIITFLIVMTIDCIVGTNKDNKKRKLEESIPKASCRTLNVAVPKQNGIYVVDIDEHEYLCVVTEQSYNNTSVGITHKADCRFCAKSDSVR